jgi:Domain of unknown function (DUF1905)
MPFATDERSPACGRLKKTATLRAPPILRWFAPGPSCEDAHQGTVRGPGQTEAVTESTNQRSDFQFAGAVWYWRGPSPYYFVRVPPELSADLADLAADVSYGWGMIPVEVTLDGHSWETSLWPKDGGYLVPIRARVRRNLGLDTDDVVAVRLTVATREGRPAQRGST